MRKKRLDELYVEAAIYQIAIIFIPVLIYTYLLLLSQYLYSYLVMFRILLLQEFVDALQSISILIL